MIQTAIHVDQNSVHVGYQELIPMKAAHGGEGSDSTRRRPQAGATLRGLITWTPLLLLLETDPLLHLHLRPLFLQLAIPIAVAKEAGQDDYDGAVRGEQVTTRAPPKPGQNRPSLLPFISLLLNPYHFCQGFSQLCFPVLFSTTLRCGAAVRQQFQVYFCYCSSFETTRSNYSMSLGGFFLNKACAISAPFSIARV